MKWTTTLCVASLAATLAACQPAPPSGPPSDAELKQLDQRVQDYFRKTVTLPPNVTLKVSEVAVAPAPGLLTATLELSNGAQTQKVPLVFTRDGRFLVQGQLADLTVDPDKATMQKITLKDQPIRGNPNATVTIVEYSDFQCPFCARAYQTLEDEVLKQYGDKVRLVFKNFPLTNIHPWAEPAALAAACVRQQKPEAFWKAYDFFFSNQQSITPENVKEKTAGVVKEAGLDVAAFDACFDNKTAMPLVNADEAEANTLGVRSTPTFFVNGRKLEGAVPSENFKTVIDQALGGAPSTSSEPQPGPATPAA